jgi:hypothetical protein
VVLDQDAGGEPDVTAFRAATLLILLLVLWFALTVLTGCAMKMPDLPPPPDPPQVLFFTEQALPDLKLCVPYSPAFDHPIACMTLGDFRALLRSRRMAMR